MPLENLRKSGLVDIDWYRETYPDVAAAGFDPAEHYLASGAAEGRNPNAFFDTAWYLASNADVREAGVNPLLHYIASGAAEGRGAGPAFDTAYYIAENPEVGTAGLNPLLHYLLYGQFENRTAVPFDEGEAFEVGLRAKQRGLSGAPAALFTGSRGDHVHFAITQRGEVNADGGPPLPPLRLVKRVGCLTLEDFDSSGQAIKETIVRAVPESFAWNGARILDFGSGVGRTLRYFTEEAQQAEIWGCDIDGSSIRWSVQNLSPPFRFFQIGEVPTLPFEDNSFDLVYAVSVLSHIHTGWQQWLMEIRRILKPGGTFFVSFMGQTPFEEMLGESYWAQGDDFGMLVKGPHQNWSDGGPMVFISPEWIKRFWGSIFDIDYIAMEGLMDYQSFCILRKPTSARPIRRDVKVLRLGTEQAHDADAVGGLQAQFDPNVPFRRSYGLDLEPIRDAVLTGWIVFRNSEACEIEIFVDGRRIAAHASFEIGTQYRDWNCSPNIAFAVEVDLSAIRPGVHKLYARLRSKDGDEHVMKIPLIIR